MVYCCNTRSIIFYLVLPQRFLVDLPHFSEVMLQNVWFFFCASFGFEEKTHSLQVVQIIQIRCTQQMMGFQTMTAWVNIYFVLIVKKFWPLHICTALTVSIKWECDVVSLSAASRPRALSSVFLQSESDSSNLGSLCRPGSPRVNVGFNFTQTWIW